jgi:SNF2 family DNA or RNA helicase
MEPPTSQPRASELREKITLVKEQLHNLRQTDNDYDTTKMILEHGLASLEEQLDALQGAGEQWQYENEKELPSNSAASSLPIIGSHRPHSSYTTSNPRDGFAPYAGSSHNAFGGHFASDGVMAGQGRPAVAPLWDFGSLDDSTTPDTPGFASLDGHSASGSNSSPDSDFLRPPKRPRDSFGVANDSMGRTTKSMRTTPSPAVTGQTTPTSLESFDLGDNSDLFRLFGGNPKEHMRELREDQKAAEQMMEERRRQELADEAFARALQGEDAVAENLAPPGQISSSWHTSQATLDSQGRLRHPEPQSLSPVTVHEGPFPNTSLPIMQENGYHNASGGLPVKQERSYQPRSYRFPDNIIDLCSDDDPDQFDTIASHPSSDFIEIDPQTFSGNNCQGQNLGSMVGSYSSYGSGGGSSNPANWGYDGPHFGQSLVNAARGVYNSAVNLVDNQITSYGQTPIGFGGTSAYGNNGLDASSNYMDLTSYTPTPTFAHDVFGRHGLNAEDPANQVLVDQYNHRVEYLTNDPTRSSAEIKSLLENIRPDEELPPENREGTPEAMQYPLMEHQKLGLTWMKSMEEGSNKGGILADDMGLGKTIQALALMVSRKSNDRLRKTTLIVCPVGLLRQWEREIRIKLKPTHQLKTYILHGEKRNVKWETLRTFDVVLTTFGTLGTEYKRREVIEMAKRQNPNWRPTGKADHLPLLGDDSKWFRVIIDEAQCIKNKSTKAALGASHLQAIHRFCMTGTPMQNSINELYSLINFLRIKPYCEEKNFKRDFANPLKGHSDGLKQKAMRQLQALLKAILLRRTKKSQIDGKPILNLPERTTEPRHAVFSDDEDAIYQSLQTRTQLQFNKFLKAGTVGKHYSNILVLLLRLRQACCHPHLIRDFSQASGATELSPEDMMKLAKELAPDVVARIREQSNLNDDCALECPVCMDMTDNSIIFVPCGHNTCSECFARISDPSQAPADGDIGEGSNSVNVKCPNCRAKVMPSKVIDHNAFKRVHMPEKIAEAFEDEAADDAETTDDSDSDDDEEDDEQVDSKGNLKDFVVEDDTYDDPSDSEDEGKGHGPGKPPFEKSKRSKKLRKSKHKGKGKATEKPPKKTLAQLKKEGQRNVKARRRYLKRLNKDWIPSAKTLETMEILRTIQERKDPQTRQCEKTIIFSQFTSLLDLLEVPIAQEGWGYTRYDGSMNANARNDAVMEFTDKKDCKIMLVSLKAGNSGLNLIAASQVIMLDPFWNPYIEEQAIDRAHRIGQQKPVQVHRVVVQNTVEDRILALQEKKRELIEAALDENASKSISRLGVRELGFLFVRVPDSL